MTDPRHLKIEDYTYDLPGDRIAKYPLPQRDASKLLVFDHGAIVEDSYANIASHIPAGTLLVFNQTKVIYARLIFKKPTGAEIEIFCLEPHGNYGDIQTAMLQKQKVQWQCMIGGASKWPFGAVLQMNVPDQKFALSARIVEHLPGSYIIELGWDNEDLTFAEVLHYAGKVPLPPYLHRNSKVTDEERYQTIFAKEEGSVAAPTAGLHFTDHVMESLCHRNIDTTFVTLHVGAGTFKPVKSNTMEGHDMHSEWLEVTLESIQSIKDHLDKGIVAVGTTSLRTLESLFWIGNKLFHKLPINVAGIAIWQWEPYETVQITSAANALNAIIDYLNATGQHKLVTRTQILITPGYHFKIIKGLVTNFHQPQSTLLLLVAALVGDSWRKIYQYALDHHYRFLSYGDGSLLWLVN